jgi:hypothetical protein
VLITILELLVAWTVAAALVGVTLGHAISRGNAESPETGAYRRAA